MQSASMGFDGAFDGRMRVRTVGPDERPILCQIYPGTSIWVESATLALLPEQVAQSESLCDSYIDQVSQVEDSSKSEERMSIVNDALTIETPSQPVSPLSAASNPFGSRKIVRFASPGHDASDNYNGADSTAFRTLVSKSAADDPEQTTLFGPTPSKTFTSLTGLNTINSNASESVNAGESDEFHCQTFRMSSTEPSPVIKLSQSNVSTKRPIPRESEESQDSLKGSIHVTRKVQRSENEIVGDTRLNGQGYHQGNQATISVKSWTENDVTPVAKPTVSQGSLRKSRSTPRAKKSLFSVAERTSVVFANSTIIDTKPQFRKFLMKEGAEIVNSVQECTILVIGKGELKKTAKLLIAVQLGRDVVSGKLAPPYN